MDYFSNAIQKAQASVDQALGIDEGIANEAMGMLSAAPDIASQPRRLSPHRQLCRLGMRVRLSAS